MHLIKRALLYLKCFLVQMHPTDVTPPAPFQHMEPFLKKVTCDPVWFLQNYQKMHLYDICEGAYTTTSVLKWPGLGKLVVCKRNFLGFGAVDMTLREAAILAKLDGKAGAPRLISVLPSLRVIIMEYCGPYNLD